MSRENLEQALQQQDWERVVKEGGVLMHDARCEEFDAAGSATDAGLFLLEHPEFGDVSPGLARIALDQLKRS